MKKLLLAIACMAMGAGFASAQNQYPSLPAEGTINLEEKSGGLGSIIINTGGDNATINRNCVNLAYLSLDGKVIKAIPASNARMVYCTQNEFTFAEPGTVNITFFKEVDNPASVPGEYLVHIPSNYFTVNGQPNQPLNYKYTIPGVKVNMKVEPAKNTVISKLNEIKVTFEDATELSFSGSMPYYEFADPADDEQTIVTNATNVTVEGNVATIIFDEYVGTGQIDIYLPAGCFTYTVNGKKSSTSETVLRYNFGVSEIQGITAYPALGTLEQLKAFNVVEEEYQIRKDYFALNLPEGAHTYLMKTNPQLFREEADGSLVAAGVMFTLKPNAEKTGWIAYQTQSKDDELNDVIKLLPGTYYLIMNNRKTDYLSYKPADSDEVLTIGGELKFGPWTVEGEPLKYTVTPSEDEVVTSVSQVVIEFPEGSKIDINKTAWFTFNYDTVQYDFRGQSEDNKIIINLQPALDIDGDYTLTTAASDITVDGINTPISALFHIKRDVIDQLSLVNNGKPVETTFVNDEPSYWTANILTATSEDETASVTFELPFGYDSVYTYTATVAPDEPIRNLPTEEIIAAGFKKLEDNTLTDLKIGVNEITFTYGAGSEVLEPTFLILTVAKNPTSGVAEVAVAEDAEYYTLQGIKVANPENGIFIKVVNGKASKVNLK